MPPFKKYSTAERTAIVTKITKNLAAFQGRGDHVYNLSNEDFAITFREICNEYIRTGERQSGVIENPCFNVHPIGEKIEYILPAKRTERELFVIRGSII